MKPNVLFDQEMPRALEDNPRAARAIDAIYVFTIKGDSGGVWTVDCRSAPATCRRGADPQADCFIEADAHHFEKVIGNKARGLHYYLTGKLRARGSRLKAAKLEALFDIGGLAARARAERAAARRSQR